MSDVFDLSNATSIENPIFSYGTSQREKLRLWAERDVNKKKLGCWTAEQGLHCYIKHFWALRSKYYYYQTRRYSDHKTGTKQRCKGAQAGCLQHISMERYLRSLVGIGKYNRIFVEQSYFQREKGLPGMTLIKETRSIGDSYCPKRYWFSRKESISYGDEFTQIIRICDGVLLDLVEAVVKNEEKQQQQNALSPS